MFRSGIISVGLTVLILIAGAQLIQADSTRSSLTYYDNERDVNAGDFEDRIGQRNIDITRISVDDSSDPIVFEMRVDREISYDSEEFDYGYYFYIDHTGDSNAESTITITRDDKYITTEYGSGGPSPITDVSGEGIMWLTVNIPLDQVSGSPGIVNIWGMADVRDGQARAWDDVNRNFGGVAPPNTEEDPRQAAPTDTSVSVSIDDFHYSAEIHGGNYDFTQGATGTTGGEVVRAYYCIAYYDKQTGEGAGSYGWDMGPIDEEHEYGGHTYEEHFHGTGAGDSWSTWEWTFHSIGPLDDSNRYMYENPEDYYQGAKIMLFIRAYSLEGWNQDSMDITDEIVGGTSGDDDTSDDDDADDDTSGDDDDGEDGSNDSSGVEMILLSVSVLMMVILLAYRRKR